MRWTTQPLQVKSDVGRLPPSVSLRVFEPTVHAAWYQSLIDQEPHRDTDFYSCEELCELIKNREVAAWLAHDHDTHTLVGWCAVVLRSPHHPLMEAVHFLGSIVASAHRGKGYGWAMVKARLALFPTSPITASVLPGNVPSERMLRSTGFRPGLMQGPWCTWHRPNDHRPMVLLEYPDQLPAFLGRGVYAECVTPPVEGGNGRITRGLWPDHAAFHAVPIQGVPSVP